MRVLVVSPEAGPWPSASTLADSVNALVSAYLELGTEVRVYSPMYHRENEPKSLISDIYQGFERIRGEAFSIGTIPKSPYYFVQHAGYFDRSGPYNDVDHIPFWDNHYRFSLLASAALLHALETGFIPDLIHCHEWGGALTAAYARHAYADAFGKIPVFLTIHNLEYDFHFLEHDIERVGLDRADYHIDGFEFWGKVSMLKAGILYADKVVFPSDGYRRQVLEHDFAGGLRGFLELNQAKVTSSQYGIDYSAWASFPVTDGVVHKQKAKEKFQQEHGLSVDSSFLVYCHLDRETMRTADTLFTILTDLFHLPLQLVIGLPAEHTERDYFQALAQQNSGRMALILLEQGTRNHRAALAASDLLFLAQTDEPSASLILKALANGVIPLTCHNLGCADLLISFEGENLDKADAILVQDPWPDQMLRSLRMALDLYSSDRQDWNRLVQNALTFKYSWEKSASTYLQWII